MTLPPYRIPIPVTPKQTFRIGSRSSRMARIGAEKVEADLARLHPHMIFERVEVSTRGDRDRKRALSDFRRPGIFTSGLEEALHRGQVDVAVHSFKDLPTELHPELEIGAVTRREDPADALVLKRGLDKLQNGSRIGTSSPRRQRIIASLGGDHVAVPVRGNIDTRIRNMDREDSCEALLVAACGLERLGQTSRASCRFDLEYYFTAPAQGTLALQCRAADERAAEVLKPLDHCSTRQAADAERELLKQLGGGCALAVAAWGRVTDCGIVLQGGIWSRDGAERISGKARSDSPRGAAIQVAGLMIEQGCLSWL